MRISWDSRARLGSRVRRKARNLSLNRVSWGDSLVIEGKLALTVERKGPRLTLHAQEGGFLGSMEREGRRGSQVRWRNRRLRSENTCGGGDMRASAGVVGRGFLVLLRDRSRSLEVARLMRGLGPLGRPRPSPCLACLKSASRMESRLKGKLWIESSVVYSTSSRVRFQVGASS